MIGSTNPSITVLIVSHDKPQLLPQAVQSVLAQTHGDWQAFLVDSGRLYDRGLFEEYSWASDPRMRIVRSNETGALRRKRAMAPWCFNECFRRGLVRGELVMYLCDDDILYPNAFATFVAAFAANPEAMAMYGSQDIGWLGADGKSEIVGERRARAPGGNSCHGRIMDCQVDYLQLCHRRSILDHFRNDEYWPEDKATEDHADGLFMEKLGHICPIYPLDVKIGQNRRTPWSLNLPANGAAPHAASAPIHETIMDAWVAMRESVEKTCPDSAVVEALAGFRVELRKLCEQDHALRRRLVSRRYQVADKMQALLAPWLAATRMRSAGEDLRAPHSRRG